MNRARRTVGQLAVIAVVAVGFSVGSCGGGMQGMPGTDKVSTDIPDKYEAYFEKCDKYEEDIEEARITMEETPGMLAEQLGLEPDATLEEIADAIAARVQDVVVKAGGHVEVTIEGGLDASAAASAGTGGASAGAAASAEVNVQIEVVGDVEVSEDLAQLIEAGEMAIRRLVEIAKKLKAIAEKTPELIEEGKELASQVSDDIKNPATAAQVTARLTEYTDMFGEVKGLLDATVEMKVELKVSFEASASAEAEASSG
jgi:hypothetical protein